MKKNEAIEELLFIKKVIDDSRRITRDDGIIHIIWGAAVSIGSLCTWILESRSFGNLLGYLWGAVYIIAFALTIVHVNRAKNRPHTLASQVYGYIWFAVGISAMITCILGIIILRLPLKPALTTISILLAGAYFVSSKIADYKWMRVVAAGWWLAAMLIMVFDESFSYPICAGATFALELLSGLYLKFFVRDAGSAS